MRKGTRAAGLGLGLVLSLAACGGGGESISACNDVEVDANRSVDIGEAQRVGRVATELVNDFDTPLDSGTVQQVEEALEGDEPNLYGSDLDISQTKSPHELVCVNDDGGYLLNQDGIVAQDIVDNFGPSPNRPGEANS